MNRIACTIGSLSKIIFFPWNLISVKFETFETIKLAFTICLQWINIIIITTDRSEGSWMRVYLGNDSKGYGSARRTKWPAFVKLITFGFYTKWAEICMLKDRKINRFFSYSNKILVQSFQKLHFSDVTSQSKKHLKLVQIKPTFVIINLKILSFGFQ